MRLLVFTLQFPPRVGGVETMAFQLCKHLARTGARVFVLAQQEPGAAEFDTGHEFETRRVMLGSTGTHLGRLQQKINLLRELSRTVRSFKPDCILCIHWDPCGYLARATLALQPVRTPYFLIAHGMELMQLPAFLPSRWAKAHLRSLALKGAKRIFAVSRFTRECVLALGVASERVSVIPNGVEEDSRSSVSGSNGNGKRPRNIITISRLVPRKGHDTALRALSQVIERLPDVIYRIVGAGPERERLERLVKDLGLQKRVTFYGQVTDGEKKQLLNECDLFVLPCRDTPADFEGFGIALLEAMQYGKPVIAGRSGGVTDFVQDGVTGALVPPNDSTALAATIERLLTNVTEARQLGENGQRLVRDNYRWDLIAEQYLSEMSSDIL